MCLRNVPSDCQAHRKSCCFVERLRHSRQTLDMRCLKPTSHFLAQIGYHLSRDAASLPRLATTSFDEALDSALSGLGLPGLPGGGHRWLHFTPADTGAQTELTVGTQGAWGGLASILALPASELSPSRKGAFNPSDLVRGPAEASWPHPCPQGVCGLEQEAGSCAWDDRAHEVKDEHGL